MPLPGAPDAAAGLPCPWLRLDPRGTVVDANEALSRLTGQRREAVLGISFDQLLTTPSRVLFQSYVQPLLRLHGNVEEFALALRSSHAAGSEAVDVLLYTARQPTADGWLLDVMLAPIRQRRRIEDEMLRIKRAADQSPGVIFQLLETADGKRVFPYASEAIHGLYGVTAEAARQSAEAVLCHIDERDRRRIGAAMRAAARELRDWRGSYRVHGDRGLRWHEAQASPRRLPNGAIVWHGHAGDVTERRAMEAEARSREDLQRLHVARSAFLARVSHELRTPLNGVLGFAQLLATDAADNLSPVQHDRIDVIESSARHLLRLINEVLDLTRIEAGPSQVDLSSFTVRPQLEAALRVLEAQALAAGVNLVPPVCEAGTRITANGQALHQVLVNLLSNAVKYNRPGGTVRLIAHMVADGVRIAVIDTGIGLTAHQVRELFQPFNRLGAERSRIEGTGLGLVISQQLMLRMGGHIGVESLPGEGSTFSLLLPAGAEPGVQAEPLLVPAPATRLPEASGQMLYVEDNPVNAILMEAIVGLRPKLHLSLAADGASALALALRSTPDLLLLDVHLPDTDGLSLLARLREHQALSGIPAIAVSAAASEVDAAAALAAGFDAYWTKPLDIDQTLSALDKLLGRQLTSG